MGTEHKGERKRNWKRALLVDGVEKAERTSATYKRLVTLYDVYSIRILLSSKQRGKHYKSCEVKKTRQFVL